MTKASVHLLITPLSWIRHHVTKHNKLKLVSSISWLYSNPLQQINLQWQCDSICEHESKSMRNDSDTFGTMLKAVPKTWEGLTGHQQDVPHKVTSDQLLHMWSGEKKQKSHSDSSCAAHIITHFYSSVRNVIKETALITFQRNQRNSCLGADSVPLSRTAIQTHMLLSSGSLCNQEEQWLQLWGHA